MPREYLYRQCTAPDGVHQVFRDDDGNEEIASVDDCSCEMYKMNGSCDHIIALRERLCMWREADDGATPLDPDNPGVCPACGSPTAIVMRNHWPPEW